MSNGGMGGNSSDGGVMGRCFGGGGGGGGGVFILLEQLQSLLLQLRVDWLELKQAGMLTVDQQYRVLQERMAR
ncbi:MAG: hypothetical protein IPP43_07165 [Chitinophagaceae bacterium]|nr:hypothetical protein [Chitinophagaceae bacterium]